MSLLRGNALALPLADASVDLIVTSPPYFALRSYTDDGEHYDGQIGSEDTPQQFLEALWAVTAECVRVLKPSGSMWVNLGDKYAGSGGHNNSGIAKPHTFHEGTGRKLATPDARAAATVQTTRRSAPDRYNQASDGVRAKSLMGLPWRYAIGCIDQLGLILRAEVIWAKPNGLPESVTDRVRRSHEQWFHFTREPRYFSAVDEIREPASEPERSTGRVENRGTRALDGGANNGFGLAGETPRSYNPLGKLPGSVWTVPTEPLRVPDGLPQHFAAFPSEWPRRIILGWSPSGVCVECGEGRRPEVDVGYEPMGPNGDGRWMRNANTVSGGAFPTERARQSATITGYACACPTPDAPTRPAVVLDPFVGTGTTVAVANALGRYGIGVDLSADYLRLAAWRCGDPGLRAKVLGVDKPPSQIDGQLDLLGVVA